MLTSRERKDYILRLIRQVAQMMAAMLLRKQSGDLAGALGECRAAVGELLGPLGDLAPRLDSETAAHMVADADVLAAWAGVVAEEADVHRLRGDGPAAAAGEKRALELALEAHLRTSADRPELLALLARLRPAVDASTLAPRHREALAGLPRDPMA
ncbi:MAG TPA: hypothetical protein VF746_17565 [Longimicrobium sp.]|jgi:hypothetical protein